MMASPARKRRKVRSDADLKILKGAERSDTSLSWTDKKELWFFQLPKDVSFRVVSRP